MVEVTGGERCEVVTRTSAFSGFVGLGEPLGILLGVPASLANLCMIEGYEVFRILSCCRGVEVGGVRALSFPFLDGAQHATGGGRVDFVCGGRRLWEGRGGG